MLLCFSRVELRVWYCCCASQEGSGLTGVSEYTVTDVPLKPKLLATLKSNNYLLNVLTAMSSRDKGGQFGPQPACSDSTVSATPLIKVLKRRTMIGQGVWQGLT